MLVVLMVVTVMVMKILMWRSSSSPIKATTNRCHTLSRKLIFKTMRKIQFNQGIGLNINDDEIEQQSNKPTDHEDDADGDDDDNLKHWMHQEWAGRRFLQNWKYLRARTATNKKQVGFMEIEIKPHFPPRKVCIASFPGYIKATQQHFVCKPWLCSDFCAFCRRPKSTWGQMPFDVRAFIRKSCLKGGESWIKGNLSPPDATTGDSAIVYNTTRMILKLDFSTTVWNITRKNLKKKS